MNSLVELDIGETGLAFVKDHLGHCGGGLAQAALQMPFGAGRVVAIVPFGTNIDRATKFKAGGLRVGFEALSQWLESYVRSLRSKSPQWSLIVQDTAAQSTDGWLKKSDEQVFFYQSNVYMFMNLAGAAGQEIAQLLVGAAGWISPGFFLRCALDENRLLRQELQADQVARFVPQIESIAFLAYDQESLVFWMSQ